MLVWRCFFLVFFSSEPNSFHLRNLASTMLLGWLTQSWTGSVPSTAGRGNSPLLPDVGSMCAWRCMGFRFWIVLLVFLTSFGVGILNTNKEQSLTDSGIWNCLRWLDRMHMYIMYIVYRIPEIPYLPLALNQKTCFASLDSDFHIAVLAVRQNTNHISRSELISSPHLKYPLP